MLYPGIVLSVEWRFRAGSSADWIPLRAKFFVSPRPVLTPIQVPLIEHRNFPLRETEGKWCWLTTPFQRQNCEWFRNVLPLLSAGVTFTFNVKSRVYFPCLITLFSTALWGQIWRVQKRNIMNCMISGLGYLFGKHLVTKIQSFEYRRALYVSKRSKFPSRWKSCNEKNKSRHAIRKPGSIFEITLCFSIRFSFLH